MISILGWDIGGAHLKLAVVREDRVIDVRQFPCPLWQGTARLRDALRAAAAWDDKPKTHAVTMTGELVDCFADRRQGVAAILDIFGEFTPVDMIRVYTIEGSFISPTGARSAPERVASANWHATARFVASHVQAGLLVDVGSTTTDIIPFREMQIVARGANDAERLTLGELAYTGIVRTPLCAVADRVPFAGALVAVMSEWFATTADAYRILDLLPDGADLHPTADGREKTASASRARLARMIGRDEASAPEDAWRGLAETFVRRQLRTIESACEQVLSAADLPADSPVVGAGIGRFLGPEIARRLNRPYRDTECLVDAIEDVAKRAAAHAPAVAVALLCREQIRPRW